MWKQFKSILIISSLCPDPYRSNWQGVSAHFARGTLTTSGTCVFYRGGTGGNTIRVLLVEAFWLMGVLFLLEYNYKLTTKHQVVQCWQCFPLHFFPCFYLQRNFSMSVNSAAVLRLTGRGNGPIAGAPRGRSTSRGRGMDWHYECIYLSSQ